MNVASLFLYTPLPWLLAMYVAAYRHGLLRFARPFRDRSDPATWWSVCRDLGLIDGSVNRPGESFGFWRWLALSATVFVSSLWTIIPLQLPWYELCGLQAAAALPFFLALVSIFGPFPYKPYRDFLPFPRLGTRVRHLKKRVTPGYSQLRPSDAGHSSKEG